MPTREIGAALMAGALWLTGCTDKNAANEANFKAAISEAIKDQSECIQFDRLFDATDGIPVDTPTRNPSNATVLERASPLLKALANLGLITLQVVHKPQLAFGSTYQAPFITVNVTEKGKPYANVRGRPSPCFGHYAIDSVDRFSQPASMMGHTISEVQYTYHVEDLPDWAHDARLIAQDDELRHLLESKSQHDKTVLVLTNKGWEDQRVAGM